MLLLCLLLLWLLLLLSKLMLKLHLTAMGLVLRKINRAAAAATKYAMKLGK